MGSILLVVARTADRAHEAAQPVANEVTAATLADALGVAETRVRVWATKLAQTGCLTEGRVTMVRRGCARRVHVYRLPVPREQRGPGRKPRWHPVALIVEPDAAAAERIGKQLQAQGTLPVAVETCSEARHLLTHVAFELVIVSASVETSQASDGEIERVRQAARAANCGTVLVLNDIASAAHPPRPLPARPARRAYQAEIDSSSDMESTYGHSPAS